MQRQRRRARRAWDDAIVTSTTEPSGDHCPAAGFKIVVGLGANGDGALGKDEISSTEYVCNAAQAMRVRRAKPVWTDAIAGAAGAPR